jgi:hypothetical protein
MEIERESELSKSEISIEQKAKQLEKTKFFPNKPQTIKRPLAGTTKVSQKFLVPLRVCLRIVTKLFYAGLPALRLFSSSRLGIAQASLLCPRSAASVSDDFRRALPTA